MTWDVMRILYIFNQDDSDTDSQQQVDHVRSERQLYSQQLNRAQARINFSAA